MSIFEYDEEKRIQKEREDAKEEERERNLKEREEERKKEYEQNILRTIKILQSLSISREKVVEQLMNEFGLNPNEIGLYLNR